MIYWQSISTTKKRLIFSFILLAIIWILGIYGCAPKFHNLTPDFQQKRPNTIAIMPVLNETIDLDGPGVITPLIHNIMQTKGYKLISPGEVKLLLAKKNVHEAGQVFSLTYPEMGKLLDADALLFCTITDWRTIYLVVYASVAVEAKFELIDAKTGTRLWDAKYKSTKRAAGWDDESLKRNVLHATLSPYDPEARNVTYRCLNTLPNGPYYIPRKTKGCTIPQ